jgi:hypothetical protein
MELSPRPGPAGQPAEARSANSLDDLLFAVICVDDPRKVTPQTAT